MAKFYELPMSERLQQLGEAGLDSNDMFALSNEGGLGAEQADHMIENVVGTYKLPLGIARNFVVNGRAVLVPMVIEEPSVVAAASYMAKLAAKGGGFTAEGRPAGDDRANAGAGRARPGGRARAPAGRP